MWLNKSGSLWYFTPGYIAGVGDATTTAEAEASLAGKTITVKGTFKSSDGTLKVMMPELLFEYKDGKWKKVEKKEIVDLTNVTFDFSKNIKDHKTDGKIQIALEATNISNKPANWDLMKGKGTLVPADENSGWYIGEQRITEPNSGVWLNKSGTYWYFTPGFIAGVGTQANAEAALAGKTITVKGRFKSTGDNAGYTVIMPELQFKYENGTWKQQ